MSIARSPNCTAYTDTLSLLVDGEAVVSGQSRCRVVLPPTFSCQTAAFESPDPQTEAFMKTKAVAALDEMGCDSSKMEMSFKTNLVGAQQLEYSGEKLAGLGMASNCYRAGNDPNDTTHTVRAECTNQYEMTNEKGERVKNTNKKFLSNLAACDVSEEAMPQLLEDVRKVARYNAGQNGYKIDRDVDLACNFSVLPH